MKKFNLLILTVLLIVPFYVKAATTLNVLTVEAEVKGSTITYNGTTEDGVYAVMCKLYNADKEEIDLLSSAVDNKKFNGEFTVSKKGEYKVACANYDGGEIKEAEVTVKQDNPKTYDAGIIGYAILIAVCVIGIVGIVIYMKRKNKV